MYSMNYKEGLIYKIICKTDDKICYIGSTFNILSQRWRDHKTNYNEWIKDKNKKKCSIYPYFEKYGIDNFKMIEIKKYKVCAENTYDKTHLSVYELLWILKHKNCVNEIKPFNPLFKLDWKINQKKYAEKNKDKIKDYQKDYTEKNKDKKKDYDKNYREKNKEKIKEKEKNYRENNKEKIKAQQKNKYQKNKYKYEEKAKIKIQCECGSLVRRNNLLRHLKSKKHQDYIKNLNNNN